MALLDAKEYDPRPAQRMWRVVLITLAVTAAFLTVWFWPSGRFRYRRQWSVANRFLSAIEQKDFDSAYGLYNADPDWKQHPEKYNNYNFSRFTSDWGPSSEFGVINSHKVDCAIEPPARGLTSASGVVVVVMVNGRAAPELLWVEKKSGTITTSPWDLEFLTRDSPIVRARCYRPG